MPIRRKKLPPQEQIKEMVKRFEALRERIFDNKLHYEIRIKSYLRRGKIPPGAWLIGWRLNDTLLSMIDSTIATLEAMESILAVGETLKEIAGSKQMSGIVQIFKQVSSMTNDIRTTLHQLLSMQSHMLSVLQGTSQNVDAILLNILGMARESIPDFAEALLSDFLERMKAIDPKFVESLPDTIKEKLSEMV